MKAKMSQDENTFEVQIHPQSAFERLLIDRLEDFIRSGDQTKSRMDVFQGPEGDNIKLWRFTFSRISNPIKRAPGSEEP